MDTRAPLTDRPRSVIRACDGIPWPSDDDLEAEAEWAQWLQEHVGPFPMTNAASSPRRSSADPAAANATVREGAPEWAPIDGDAAARSDLDARLGHLELTVAARHRAAAEEGRAIAALLRDAAADPTPWVGPDPTLDLAWNDARGRTIAAVRRDRADLAERSAVAEIAVRLRLSEQTVRARAAQVEVLRERCPTLWQQFTIGRTSDRHAADAARLAASLPHDDPSSWAAFDAGAARLASTLVPSKFAVSARGLRERVHAESLDARHRRAARDRGVWMTPELDGMASLSAMLPADRARSIMSRLDRVARHLHAAPDEERTLAQLRADVLADLVTSPPVESGDAAGPPAHAPEATDDAAEAASLHRSARSRRDGVWSTADEPDATAAPCPYRQPQPQRRDPRDNRPPTAGPSGIAAGPQSHDPLDPPPTTHPPGIPACPSPHAALPRGDNGPRAGANPGDNADPVTATLTAAAPSAPSPHKRRRQPVPATGATVVITVPALTLLGVDEEPATLEGYGPIDLYTARRLAGEASSWVRLLTHPITGAPLILDRKTYRVPVALRRWLGVTSPTCVFPGCNRAARECDLDHLVEWAAGGTTDADNLQPECRHHHRLRHETRWNPSHDPETGDLRWTSPLGGTYDADPPPF